MKCQTRSRSECANSVRHNGYGYTDCRLESCGTIYARHAQTKPNSTTIKTWQQFKTEEFFKYEKKKRKREKACKKKKKNRKKIEKIKTKQTAERIIVGISNGRLISLWLCHCSVPRMRRFWFGFWLTNLARCCYCLVPPATSLLPTDCFTIRFSLKLINVNDAFKSFWWTAAVPLPLSGRHPQLPYAAHPGTKKKEKKEKKITQNLCTIFVFYAIFTDCHVVDSLPVRCCLICKPICNIVHVSRSALLIIMMCVCVFACVCVCMYMRVSVWDLSFNS